MIWTMEMRMAVAIAFVVTVLVGLLLWGVANNAHAATRIGPETTISAADLCPTGGV